MASLPSTCYRVRPERSLQISVKVVLRTGRPTTIYLAKLTNIVTRLPDVVRM